jgi:choline dehydrogenase-like flavoprotein
VAVARQANQRGGGIGAVMDRIVVVGSGASGAHFALTALRRGRRVLMLDVGHTGSEHARPGDTLNGLKRRLADPVEYFLGSGYESLVLPGNQGEYYAFPPAKEHVFRPHREFAHQSQGFSPLVSFATGGLAEAWTGGCYPFHDREMGAFPFGYRELEPFYSEVARRIGVTGADDDLASVFPLHEGLMEPLELDRNSRVLLESYQRRREQLHAKLGCLVGRARVAVLSRDLGHRKACSYSGRCLWGCPSGAFYTPSLTIAECRQYPGFEYASGMFVDHFRMNGGGKVRGVVARRADGGTQEFPADSLVLAAGTLSSARIFLESMYRYTGKAPELGGIMDNRQVLMPFVNLRMLGRQWSADTYQYHQVAMAVKLPGEAEHIHGLVTTLKTALIHPLVQTLPFDLGTSVAAFRNVHGALGMININFPDNRRAENTVSLDVSSTPHRVVVRYTPEPGEPERLRGAIKRFRKILWKLGCFAPSGTIHVRPKGASVHYAGTLPMSAKKTPLTCSPDCRSHDVENLYFVDGTAFPYLPAKNLTFTLMANATRVAAKAC